MARPWPTHPAGLLLLAAAMSQNGEEGMRAQVDFGLPQVSPAPERRIVRDLKDLTDMDLVRTASTLQHSPLDHDTQVNLQPRSWYGP